MATTWTHKGASSKSKLEQVRPGVLLLTLHGEIGAIETEHIVAALDKALEKASEVALFVDTGAMTRYDSALRIRGTQVLLRHAKPLRRIVVLATSPLARMGLQVACLVVRNMQAVHDSAEFEALLADAELAK